MHSTRIATFLLGAWIAVSLWLNWSSLHSLGRLDEFLHSPNSGAADIIRPMGTEQGRLLLHSFAAEQIRSQRETWEAIQIPLALLLAAVIYFAVEKRPVPLIFCGLMLALVLVQYFAITPELSYRGRQTDFPRGPTSNSQGVRGVADDSTHLGTLTALYIATEGAKLTAGAVLASYFFNYRSRRRKRRDEDPEEIAKAAALRGGSTAP